MAEQVFEKVALTMTAATSTATGDAIDVSMMRDVVSIVQITAKTGTITLDVAWQGSYDGTNFFAFKTAKAHTQLSAVGGECLCMTNLPKFVRAVGTIGGSTPVITGTVKIVGKSNM